MPAEADPARDGSAAPRSGAPSAREFPLGRATPNLVAFIGVGVFAAGFGILVLGLAPSGGWRDVTEFQWAAAVLGIPHPPGSPIPALLGRVLALMPVGAIAWRVNLLSCLAGAGGLALAYWVAVEVLGLTWPRVDARVTCGIALAAPLALLGSPVYREHAATAEVYALQALLAATLAWQWVRIAERAVVFDVRPIASLVLLCALATGVHISFAFYLAGILAWFLVRERERLGPRAVSLFASLVVLGGLVFAYVPLRAAAHPSINWGDAVTLDRLGYHLSDRKDWEHRDDGKTAESSAGTAAAGAGGVTRTVSGWGQVVSLRAKAVVASCSLWCGFLVSYLRGEVGIVTSGLALLGFVLLLVRAPAAGGAVALLVASHLAFAIPIGKWANPTGYNPIYLLVSVLACVPVGLVFEISMVRRSHIASGFLVLVALLPGATRLAGSWASLEGLATDFRSDDLSREMVRPLEPDAILLAAHLWPLFGYLREVEGYRTDVDVVFRNEIYETQRMRLDPARLSEVVVPPRRGSLETRADRVLRMREFLDLNHRAGRPIAWQSEADDLYFRVRPAGLLFGYSANDASADLLKPTADTTSVLDAWLASFEPGGARRGWLREVDDFEEAVLPVARYAGWRAAHLECEEASRWWARARAVLGPAAGGLAWPGGLDEMVRLCPGQRAASGAGVPSG